MDVKVTAGPLHAEREVQVFHRRQTKQQPLHSAGHVARPVSNPRFSAESVQQWVTVPKTVPCNQGYRVLQGNRAEKTALVKADHHPGVLFCPLAFLVIVHITRLLTVTDGFRCSCCCSCYCCCVSPGRVCEIHTSLHVLKLAEMSEQALLLTVRTRRGVTARQHAARRQQFGLGVIEHVVAPVRAAREARARKPQPAGVGSGLSHGQTLTAPLTTPGMSVHLHPALAAAMPTESRLEEGAGIELLTPTPDPTPAHAGLAADADDLAPLDDDDVAVLADDGALHGVPPGGPDEARHALGPPGAAHDEGARGAGQAGQAVEAGAGVAVPAEGGGGGAPPQGGEEGGETVAETVVSG